MKALTEKQKKILEFIHVFTAENRYPPSIREIGSHFGMKSNNAVNDHLEALKRKECIRRSGDKHTSRSIVITSTGNKFLGLVDASTSPGMLISVPVIDQPEQLSEKENVKERISVDMSMFSGAPSTSGNGGLFAYRARGDIMAKAGIRNGDILLISSQDKANSDDIALVKRNGDLIVRRYSLDGDRIRLQLADETIAPEYVDAAQTGGEFAVLGVVAGLIRTKL